MPGDVRTGYWLLDSVARNATNHAVFVGISSMLDRESDTLRTVLKYLYSVKDYDPITLLKATRADPEADPSYRSSTGYILDEIEAQVVLISPESDRTLAKGLFWSDYILRIRVNSTANSVDSNSTYRRHAVLVNATITDVIKGQRIPDCGSGGLLDDGVMVQLTPSQAADSGDCIRFQYRTEYKRGHSIFGNTLFKPDREYVVFLRYLTLTGDTVQGYLSLIPATIGASWGVYPIVNGLVVDAQEDFAFGAPPSIALFKEKFRDAIDDIVNYVPKMSVPGERQVE